MISYIISIIDIFDLEALKSRKAKALTRYKRRQNFQPSLLNLSVLFFMFITNPYSQSFQLAAKHFLSALCLPFGTQLLSFLLVNFIVFFLFVSFRILRKPMKYSDPMADPIVAKLYSYFFEDNWQDYYTLKEYNNPNECENGQSVCLNGLGCSGNGVESGHSDTTIHRRSRFSSEWKGEKGMVAYETPSYYGVNSEQETEWQIVATEEYIGTETELQGKSRTEQRKGKEVRVGFATTSKERERSKIEGWRKEEVGKETTSYGRVKSERQRVSPEEHCERKKELRRTRIEECGSRGVGLKETTSHWSNSLCELSDEEFNKMVEAFIAKQLSLR